MPRKRIVVSPLFAVAASVLLVACSQNPEPGRYTVELQRVQISPHDFNLNAFGNPFNIEVKIVVNGEAVPPVKDNNVLSGSRGERKLKEPVKWDIVYDPASRYMISVEEKNIISAAVRWSIPATPRMGRWPFGTGEKEIDFGRDSYLGFNTNPQ